MFCESLSTYSPSMARPFPEVYYDEVVPRQQLLNKALQCVPFQNKRLPLNICFLSRQSLLNCTFIMANIINSKLTLFSARVAEKLVLNGCFEYEIWRWFPLNMRRLVAQLKTRTRTRTGSKLPRNLMDNSTWHFEGAHDTLPSMVMDLWHHMLLRRRIWTP